MASLNKEVVLLLLLRRKLLLLKKKRRRTEYRRKKARWWVHPIWSNRKKEGDFHTLLKAMRIHDHVYFRNYTRMSPAHYDKLLGLLSNSLKRYPVSREAISPAHRLAVTLRYLATGNSLISIAYAFRLGLSTTHYIVRETCQAIWDVLMPIYLKSPTERIWKDAAAKYYATWQFPNCIGAVDGKHVLIQQPKNTGSMYYNYKGTNSINLMAVVNADYTFLAVDIGAYGSNSDGGVLKASAIGRALENNKLNIPGPSILPETNIIVPHVMVGDDAFQLRPEFLKPYNRANLDDKKRVFNYRLSRARRCSENAFGILGARWRIFRRAIILSPENVDAVTKAAVVLHNYIMTEEAAVAGPQKVYCPPGYVENEAWRSEAANAFANIPPTRARNFVRDAAAVRDVYADYFFSENGQVAWQWDIPGVRKPHNLTRLA